MKSKSRTITKKLRLLHPGEHLRSVLEDAAKLQGLLKQIQEFWASLDTHDAIDLAKSAQDGASTVMDKIKGKDFDAAQVAFGTIREACRDCHFSHRQTTGEGFVIKP